MFADPGTGSDGHRAANLRQSRDIQDCIPGPDWSRVTTKAGTCPGERVGTNACVPLFKGAQSKRPRLKDGVPGWRLLKSVVQSSLPIPIDRDALGFRLFGHDPLQVDAEQTIVQVCALDLDMVIETEGQLESPLGDALMQEGNAFFAGAFTFAAAHGQHTFLYLQVQIILLEPRRCHHDTIAVFTTFFNVVRWVPATGLIA